MSRAEGNFSLSPIACMFRLTEIIENAIIIMNNNAVNAANDF